MLRARLQRSRSKIRVAQRSRPCPTLHCFPVGSRSRSETKSSLRSASVVRRAATRMRPAPRPVSRASRMILHVHGECSGRMKETSMSSEKKVAVITGASRGMGAALVEAYRDLGYGVVATARSIRPTNDDQILVVPGDITDRKTAERAISEGLARFGRIDTLINNAGVFVAKPFTQYTAADYAAVLGVNLTGFFHMTQLAIAEMEKRGSGHIVQITTSLVAHANSNVPSVLASLTKGGLDAATRSLAIEYAKRGIRVNAVAPGVIKTPMHAVETYDTLASLHPLGRMGEISDIVDAILYLESAGFVTGETIHVDGGQSAGH